MILIDTHTHLYLDNYKDDRDIIVQEAINQKVEKMILPAIDKSTFGSMMALSDRFPANCLPMIGLHPTSVTDNYKEELDFIKEQIKKYSFIAIGEIGIDLYWDDTHFEEQKDAFRTQLRLAKLLNLPVAIHTRDSFDEIYTIVKEEKTEELIGVFHCFTGNVLEAKKIIDLGFNMGIGGIITFKNSGLADVVKQIPIKHLLLETDSPFLTPTPFRGKRNQSSYINLIATKLSQVFNTRIGDIAEQTTKNAIELFKLK